MRAPQADRSRSTGEAASSPRCPSRLQQGCLLLVAPGPQDQALEGAGLQIATSGPRRRPNPLFGVFSRKCCSARLFAGIYGLLSHYDRVFRTRTGSPCPEYGRGPEGEGQPLRSPRVSAPGWSRERPGGGGTSCRRAPSPGRAPEPARSRGPHPLPPEGRERAAAGPGALGGALRSPDTPMAAAVGLTGRERGEGRRARPRCTAAAPGPPPPAARSEP